MHVYNAIIVLKEILPAFPLASVTDTGAALYVAIERFQATEERGDLKILASSYSASLKKRETRWAVSKAPNKVCWQGFFRRKTPIYSLSDYHSLNQTWSGFWQPHA